MNLNHKVLVLLLPLELKAVLSYRKEKILILQVEIKAFFIDIHKGIIKNAIILCE